MREEVQMRCLVNAASRSYRFCFESFALTGRQTVSTTLADVINQCFKCATDRRFSEQQQTSFLADGKRLRGLLLNLLSAQFDDGTQAVVDANNQLETLNQRLSNSAHALANTAKRIQEVADLVGNLDKLLNIAVSFL